jgi:hypothetical protein
VYFLGLPTHPLSRESRGFLSTRPSLGGQDESVGNLRKRQHIRCWPYNFVVGGLEPTGP